MMEILAATGNAHKKEEMGEILTSADLILPQELGLTMDFEETGTTFEANAYGKALHLFQQAGGRPVLADDSGLCVPALGGEPGVYSARYGSSPGQPTLTAEEKNQLLLSRMEEQEDRRAFFVCCMVLILGEYRFYTVQETIHGQLTRKPSGTGGFGYDPIFFLPDWGRTIAELPGGEKNKISHRGRAGARLNQLLTQGI